MSLGEIAAAPLAATADNRQVKGSIAKMVLSYVKRVLGPDAVQEVLAIAGREWPDATLSGPAVWTSPGYTLAIADAASAICGDPEIGRRAGEEMMRLSRERGTVDVIVAAGSLEDGLALTANLATKMSDGRSFELVECSDGHARVVATFVDRAYADPFWCGQTVGYWGLLPELFGYAGVIAEVECMSRGDDRCVMELRWSGQGARVAVADEVDASRGRLRTMADRFEQLHTMATELATADDIDTVLARIAERAGVAIDAPRYLLAVRTHAGDEIRRYQAGFPEERVDRFAERLLAGEIIESERCLVEDVASPSRKYGRMMVDYPRASAVSEMDRRLLRAYARHAAAALDAVASLESARRDRDTAQALLALAQELAQVRTRADVAERLTRAVPRVVDCESVSVWLWDDDGRTLTRHAAPGGEVVVLRDAEARAVAEVAMQPAPFTVSGDHARSELGRLLDGRIAPSAIVPIAARETFLGIMTVAAPGVDSPALHRLGALADQAGTAIDNADLLDRIRRQALHDSLTGLPNRQLMEDRAHVALERRRRSGGAITLLFIDLDRFKNVNDTLGHEAGDEVIRSAALRLRATLRTSDTLARLGGDEFVAMIDGTCDGAVATAERMLDALRAPFSIAGRDVFISCSIGIATAPDHGDDYATLVRQADAAMYQAKQAGRSGYAVHVVDRIEARRQQLDLEADLHQAIGREELRLLYQPQIDLETLQIVGVEALVRWEHPSLGLLTPDRFIPIAEDSGLIGEIDTWVRQTAFAQARSWMDAGINLRMAVNLSTRVLRDPTLARQIANAVRESGLQPADVELEVTDRVTINDDELPAVLGSLHALGVRMAIDDFGTGTSAFGRLERCHFHTLKIDRSFIRTIASGREAPVVTALLAMARSMGTDVVAEGIETQEQADFLRSAGCQLGQGFLFSRPVCADEIVAAFRSQLCGA